MKSFLHVSSWYSACYIFWISDLPCMNIFQSFINSLVSYPLGCWLCLPVSIMYKLRWEDQQANNIQPKRLWLGLNWKGFEQLCLQGVQNFQEYNTLCHFQVSCLVGRNSIIVICIVHLEGYFTITRNLRNLADKKQYLINLSLQTAKYKTMKKGSSLHLFEVLKSHSNICLYLSGVWTLCNQKSFTCKHIMERSFFPLQKFDQFGDLLLSHNLF